MANTPTGPTSEATTGMGGAAGQTTQSVEPASTSEPRALLDLVLYGASLPERVVRSAFGVTAGTARELAEFLVPMSFKDSKTYEIVIRNSMDFLVGKIGGVDLPQSTSATPPAENYVARKAVSNFMDLAGIATLHTSPMWVMAIISDLAYGSKTYVRELAQELQSQGLIDDASTIHRVDDVLNAVRQASGTAASSLDLPPLSLDELKKSLDETRKALAGADPRQLFPEAEISRLWGEMRHLATQEEISLLGVSGLVAMQTLNTVKSVSQGTLASVVVAGQLVNRNVLTYYVDSISRISSQGVFQTLDQTYEPYVKAIWTNFQNDRETLTETLLRPKTYSGLWGKLTGKMTGWFRRRPEQAEASPAIGQHDGGDLSDRPSR